MKHRILALTVATALLLAIMGACGPEPTPTEVVLPPTDTPVPPTDTPAPAPEPLDPSALAPPEDLDSYVFTEEMLWEGTAPDGSEASYQSGTTLEYVDDPLAIHLTATSNEPRMEATFALIGLESDTMDVYIVEGSAYLPAFGSWMMFALDAPATATGLGQLPFDPERLAQGEVYTVTQWIDSAEFVGMETYSGVEVEHYSFDETAINADLLPEGMEVGEASGNLYITVEGGYLLRMDMTLSGTGLVLSEDAEEATLSEGTLQFTSELSAINEPLTIELPEEAVQATSLPADIPLPADANQLMGLNLIGMQGFLFASDSSPEDVAAFYQAEMPQNGWTESGAAEDAGSYVFLYTQDERSVRVDFGPDDDTGKTLISIELSAAGEALQGVEPSAAQSVADDFMTALRDGDYATAYDLCAPDLQAEFDSAEDLGAWMQANDILPLDWTFTSENVVDSMIQLLGTATFAEVEAELDMILVEVDGEPLVAGFHLR